MYQIQQDEIMQEYMVSFKGFFFLWIGSYFAFELNWNLKMVVYWQVYNFIRNKFGNFRNFHSLLWKIFWDESWIQWIELDPFDQSQLIY